LVFHALKICFAAENRSLIIDAGKHVATAGIHESGQAFHHGRIQLLVNAVLPIIPHQAGSVFHNLVFGLGKQFLGGIGDVFDDDRLASPERNKAKLP